MAKKSYFFFISFFIISAIFLSILTGPAEAKQSILVPGGKNSLETKDILYDILENTISRLGLSGLPGWKIEAYNYEAQARYDCTSEGRGIGLFIDYDSLASISNANTTFHGLPAYSEEDLSDGWGYSHFRWIEGDYLFRTGNTYCKNLPLARVLAEDLYSAAHASDLFKPGGGVAVPTLPPATQPPEQPPNVNCSDRSCETRYCDGNYSTMVQRGVLYAEAKTCYVNSPEMSTFVCGMIPDADEHFGCDFVTNTCAYTYRFYCTAGCEEAVGLCNQEIAPSADCSDWSCQKRGCEGDFAVTAQYGVLDKATNTCLVNSPNMPSFSCSKPSTDTVVYDCDLPDNTCAWAVAVECAAGCNPQTSACNPSLDPSSVDCSNLSCEDRGCDGNNAMMVQYGRVDKSTNTCYVNSPDMTSFSCNLPSTETLIYDCSLPDDTCAWGTSVECATGCNLQTLKCNPAFDPSTVDCKNRSCEVSGCANDKFFYRIQKGQLDSSTNTCYVNSPEVTSFNCGKQDTDTKDYTCYDTYCEYSSLEECPAGCNEQTDQCNPITMATVPPQGNWDLEVTRVSLIQAIEGATLVAGKPTAVRVFLYWPDTASEVTAEVSLMIDNIEFQTKRQVVKHTYTNTEKKANQDTVIFHIPKGKLSPGTHTFTVVATLQPPSSQTHIVDPDELNNSKYFSREFANTTSLTILMGSAHATISQADIWSFVSKALPHFLDVTPFYNVDIAPKFIMLRGNEVNLHSPLKIAINMAYQRYLYNSQLDPGVSRADYSVTLFPDNHFGLNVYGFSFRLNRRNVLVGAGNTNPPAHEGMVHEIAHYPLGGKDEHNDETVGKVLPNDSVIYKGHSGILEDLRFSGTQYLNIMGEAGSTTNPIWVNIETWNKFVNQMSDMANGSQPNSCRLYSPARQSGVALNSGWLVSGSVASEGLVRMDSMLWLDFLEPPEILWDETDYAFQVIGKGGSPIANVPVFIDFSLEDPMPFTAIIPAEIDAVSRLELARSGQVIWSVEPPSGPPSVSISAPASSEPLSGTVTISWSGSDPAGEELSYTLFLSVDDGATWLPLASGLKDQSYSMNTDELPGCGACMLRVLASNGWYTAIATTQTTFSMANKPPVVEILSPSDGYRAAAGESVIFAAMGFDPEIGIMPDEQLSWFSDIDSYLGDGERLEVADLSSGTHTITVMAEDSEGAYVRDTIQIRIGNTVVSSPPSSGGSDFDFFTLALICGIGLVGVLIVVGVVVLVRRRGKKEKETSPPQKKLQGEPKSPEEQPDEPQKEEKDVPPVEESPAESAAQAVEKPEVESGVVPTPKKKKRTWVIIAVVLFIIFACILLVTASEDLLIDILWDLGII